MGGKVCIAFADGCPRSEMDTGLLFSYFQANGWTTTTDPGEADMILVGTCGFSQMTEEISVSLVSNIVKKNPNATLVAFGCLPGINEEALTERFNVIPLVRSALHRLDEIIDARVPISEIMDVNVLDPYIKQARNVFTPAERKRSLMRGSRLLRASHLISCFCPCSHLDALPSDEVFNIRVAHGCLSECNYCAIKRAAGSVRSKPLGQIKNEFERGLSEGYRAFCLVAEDVGAYGQDIGLNIVDLLLELFSHKERFVLSWDDFHPRWLLQYASQLLPLLADNQHRIGRIGLPVQSGSERILRLMNREYTAAEVADCLSKLRTACPHLRIDTHFLIGFPGETSRDFADTLEMLERIRFHRATPFLYTDRPQTKSAEMPGKVSTFRKCRRLWQFRRKAAGLMRSRPYLPSPTADVGRREVRV